MSAQSGQVERVGDRGDVVEVGLDRIEAETHRDHRDMRTTNLAPGIDLGRELAHALARERRKVRTEVVHGPAKAAHALTHLFPRGDAVVEAATEYEAIGEPSSPLERHGAKSSKPDRDGPRRLRHKCGSINAVEAAGEVDDRFGEQPAEKIDLLLLPSAAGAEVLTEGLVLDVAPTDPHTEPQPTAREQIDIGCLPGHECGLALRQDEDARGELDPLGDAGQIGEHHERIVEWVMLGIRARQRERSIGVHGAEHMLIGEEVIKAEILDRFPDAANRVGISSKLGLRVDDTDLHVREPATRWTFGDGSSLGRDRVPIATSSFAEFCGVSRSVSAMSATDWGMGVPGALGPEAIGILAAVAEQSGYQSFWFNCVAPDADPAALLDAALAGTQTIDIGVGVIPLTGYPPATLADSLRGGRADDARVILGVGSGGTRLGSLRRVSDGIVRLRAALPQARIAVGCKGPRMVALAAENADALLFSMLKPDEAHAITRQLLPMGGRPVSTYTYHRVALDPGARKRVKDETVSHGAWPAGADMPAARDLLGTVLPSRSDVHRVVDADLAAYPDEWLPVLRPLPSRPGELDDWRDLFDALAPTR
jgi:Luciferase-like monooxygenase